jgi:hypothetical protein
MIPGRAPVKNVMSGLHRPKPPKRPDAKDGPAGDQDYAEFIHQKLSYAEALKANR